jgi:hypothetical protein
LTVQGLSPCQTLSLVGCSLRIPGLARTNAIDHCLASQNLLTWSADFPADDWTRISPAQVYTQALQRIEANTKGILPLHDIQARTIEALPDLLHELKRRGYHIVRPDYESCSGDGCIELSMQCGLLVAAFIVGAAVSQHYGPACIRYIKL